MNTTNITSSNSKFFKTCYIVNDQAQEITGFPTRGSMVIHIFAVIFAIIITFATVFLNGVTAITIWRSRILKEKTSNFTILLQSIVDLANGVFFMPLVSFRFANEAVGGTNCALAIFLKKFGMLIFFYTLTTLSVMNFDRYLGIVHPFYHRGVVTNTKLLAYVVSICSVQTIIYGFSLTHKEIVAPILSTTTILFILTTVFVYVKIFLKIRDTNRMRAAMIAAERSDASTNASEKCRMRKGRFLKEIKAAKSSFLIVMCCLATFAPGALSFGHLDVKSSFKAVAIKTWFVLLAMLKSTLNPVMYFWTNAMLRKQGKDQIKNIFSSKRS